MKKSKTEQIQTSARIGYASINIVERGYILTLRGTDDTVYLHSELYTMLDRAGKHCRAIVNGLEEETQ